MDRITLALEPHHLDYIVRLLKRCPWEEANPLLADIHLQIQPQAAPPLVRDNGVVHDKPLEASP